MRKILMATSALALMGASASFAQDFEPTDMNDEATPDVVDADGTFEPGVITGSTAGTTAQQPFMWLNQGYQAADGFRPSDQNDQQAPDFAEEQDVFDEGAVVTSMAPARPALPLDQGVAATEGFEPSDASDEQAPDFATTQDVFDEGATVAATGVDTSVTTASIQAVPEPAVQYVISNPLEPATVESRLSAGMAVPATVSLQPIPDYPQFAYIYLDDGPAVVDANTRTVVWVR